MTMGAFALFVAFIGSVHISQDTLAVDSLIESLCGARTVRVFVRVLLVDIGFLFGTFGLSLPVAAELVVDQFVCGEVSLACVRIVFNDFLHSVLVPLLAH